MRATRREVNPPREPIYEYVLVLDQVELGHLFELTDSKEGGEEFPKSPGTRNSNRLADKLRRALNLSDEKIGDLRAEYRVWLAEEKLMFPRGRR